MSVRSVLALPIRLHLVLEGRSLQTVKGKWRERGAAVSTLLEPNLLVQSCVKNVRDLFQALSRCGFTSVNPFTHRSPAVRLPRVAGGTGACPGAAGHGALGRPHARSFGVKHPKNPVAFYVIPAADQPRPARSLALTHLSLYAVWCFDVAR